jgi:GT2 family glycosyltransferase
MRASGARPTGAVVSVVVPVCNVVAELPALCEALARQSLPPDRAEVLFVDNGSSDGSVAWLERWLPENGRLLFSPRPYNAYAARNEGIRRACGQVVAFTDADCRPERDWLEQGLAAVQLAQRVAGRIVVQRSSQPNWVERLDASRFLRQQRYVVESFAATANLFVRMKVFESVGHFDERLISGGDQEFGARAHAVGASIDYAPGAIVRHPARRRFGDLLGKAHRVGVGFGQALHYHSLERLAARQRIADRVGLIRDVAMDSDLPPPTRLALCAGQALLAATTAAGLVDGYCYRRGSRNGGKGRQPAEDKP